MASGSEQEIEGILLSNIARDGKIDDTYVLAKDLSVDHQVLVGVVKSLLVDRYVIEEPLSTSFWTLTADGKNAASNGSPEFRVINSVFSAGEEGITIDELNSQLGEDGKIGMGICMKNKWVRKSGDRLIAAAVSVVDETASALRSIDAGESIPEDTVQALRKRKLVTQVTRKSYRLLKGPDFKERRVRKVADLHRSMIEVRH